jgi:hypothetical protein
MPTENTDTVMDAVNAALGESLSTPEPAPEPDIEPDIEPEGDPEGEGEGEPEAEAEAEAEAEPEAEGNGERNADGTFKKKEAPTEKPKEGEAEKPKLDKDGKPIVEPKKVDPVNDPIPKDLKKDTQDRIRTLIDTTKTITAERDELRQNFDYMVKGVQDTGTTPAQYGETLSWLALFNSPDPKNQEKALELVESVAERLSMLLGKERAIGDPMAAHADLKEAVAKGQITAQYAKEIARTRNGQTFRTEMNTNAGLEQQKQQAAVQELSTAKADLSALEQTLIASDPSYAAKKSILVPALQPIFASIPPSQWKSKFMEAYRNIKVNAPAARPKLPVNNPLRPKQPAGGQTKAPTSMLEAITGALGSMGK